jgi:endonuclease YncB( thermonuclease family)
MLKLFAFLSIIMTGAAGAESVTVSRVLDGDTFVIDTPCSPLLPGKNLSIRIAGIDTPESSRTFAKCEKEVAAGLAAKVFMRSLLPPGSSVALTVVGPDKYSCRIVADAAIDGKDLATAMLEAGHARPYDGGRKSSWCD